MNDVSVGFVAGLPKVNPEALALVVTALRPPTKIEILTTYVTIEIRKLGFSAISSNDARICFRATGRETIYTVLRSLLAINIIFKL